MSEQRGEKVLYVLVKVVDEADVEQLCLERAGEEELIGQALFDDLYLTIAAVLKVRDDVTRVLIHTDDDVDAAAQLVDLDAARRRLDDGRVVH
jgi:hypothetical protein